MAGDLHAPEVPEEAEECAPENVGRTGYGELRGGEFQELTGIYGNDPSEVLDYPASLTPLERFQWWNHSLRTDFHPAVSSPADNQRMWQMNEIEKMLDHTPPHEIHPSELPDYHYWPSIMNELEHKPKVKSPAGCGSYPHHMDRTDVPRFFRSGVPKTPLQEQDWYVPLTQEGRFDWRANIRQNGYTGGLCSRAGWDQRFLLSLNRPLLPGHIIGLRQFVQLPIFFRFTEHSLEKRLIRNVSATNFDRHHWFFGLYLGAMAMASAGDAHWRKLNWESEPWNYDMKFCQYNRDKGGFHGVV